MARQRPNWREGYQEHLSAHADQLRDWRKRGVGPCFELPSGKRRFPREMNDRDIADVARQEAEKDIQRAINEWNHAEAAQRRRAGEGL